MDDDLHVAALGDKLDIARIQARRVARLRDAHAVFAAGLVAARLKRLPIVCVWTVGVIISVPPLLLTRIFCPRASARLASPPTE